MNRAKSIWQKAGHQREMSSTPRFWKRPLWIESGEDPERVLGYGYNAVVIQEGDPKPYQEAGLQVIVTDPQIQGADALFQKKSNNLFDREGADLKTRAELILEEIQELEALGLPLIYYLDETRGFEEIVDGTAPSTTISFPTFVDGEIHPIWLELRKSPDTSSTPFLPLLEQENLHRISEILSRMYRHNFAGLMVCTSEIPGPGTEEDCHLWVAAQSQCHSLAPHLLQETWTLIATPNLPHKS